MRPSTLLWSILALATGEAVAASMSHNHAMAHKRMHELEEPEQEMEKRDASHISRADLSHLKRIGFVDGGINSEKACGNAWIGKDGPFKNTFINRGGEPLVLVVWGDDGSWVNAKAPLITVSIPAGKKKTISFASGATGAWAAVGKHTKLDNGQVCDTWGEYTFAPQYGVVDVSREVNMKGRQMSIHGPKCTTDMDTCVFVCPKGMISCWKEYELHNCDNGSQAGATYGHSAGMPSGGCGGMGSRAHLKTILGK